MNNSLSDDRLQQLSDFVAARMGLYFPRKRWVDLERQTNSAAREFGFADADAFLSWLLSSPLTREQIEMLASHLTVAETYFWREPQVFEALRDQILPALIHQREQSNKRLRIWSAGCATGEEAYSITIVLRQLIPDLKNWNITLLATDINPHILRRAATGVYGEWSFRNAPPGLKEEFFSHTADGKFQILPEIRRMVTFAYLNLAEDVYPSPTNNTNAMDLIFCRNVLMYFVTERARLVGQHFFQCLLENGWLIVSSSELSQHVFAQFAPIRFPGAIVYRREATTSRPSAMLSDASAQTLSVQPPAQAAPTIADATPQPLAHPRERPRSAETGETAKAETSPDVTPAILALANQGELGEALSACEQALTVDKLNPGLHYLGAIILQELNQVDTAMAALRRALYLDPNFVLAHFTLGNLSMRQGNTMAARKSFTNVLSLLSAYDSDDLLPEADGLTTGRLREIVRATLQTGESM